MVNVVRVSLPIRNITQFKTFGISMFRLHPRQLLALGKWWGIDYCLFETTTRKMCSDERSQFRNLERQNH